MAAPLKISTGAAAIELPEQIWLDLKTSIGPIRQLRCPSNYITAPLVSFTIDRISGWLYHRSSGERLLLVERKITPPERIDEVLWL